MIPKARLSWFFFYTPPCPSLLPDMLFELDDRERERERETETRREKGGEGVIYFYTISLLALAKTQLSFFPT